MDNKSLAQSLSTAGFSVYQDRHNYALPRALDNLPGRTHYVDDSTRRYFRSRVLSSHVLEGGLFFGIVESCSANSDHSARIFRGVIFDIDGTTVYRPAMDDSFKTRAIATREFWRAADAIDARKYYAEFLARKATRLETDAAALRAIVATL